MMDFKFYFSLFLRRLHYFLLFLALGTALGVILAAILPPVYRARAVLVVESEQIPTELAASTVRTEATEALQIIQQRILTRDRLLEMANRLRIYEVPGSQTRQRMTADDIVSDLRRRIVIQTTGGGSVQATIVIVSFEAPTAALSATVANEIVTLILQENVAIRTNVAGQTLEYFVQEVERLDRELIERGAEILAFQERNLNALPDSLDFRRSQQAANQERLLQLDREEGALSDLRTRLVAMFDSTGQVMSVEPDTMTAEERQLQGLLEERSAALAVLSPQNPRIRLMDAQIAALEARIAAQPAETDDPEAVVSPGLSAYEIRLADIDAQLDFIGVQKEQIATTMEDLRVSIEATPGNAITLDTLQRAYANVRVQYDQAVANRARAETGDTIEALSKGQRISVIEQAVAPQEPESPNRPLIAAAGVGGGLALGFGIVVLLELLNTAVRRPADITAKLGITPFGTLPLVRTRGEILRRRVIIGLAFLIVIAGVPAGLWWVHTYVTPLDLLMQRVINKLS